MGKRDLLMWETKLKKKVFFPPGPVSRASGREITTLEVPGPTIRKQRNHNLKVRANECTSTGEVAFTVNKTQQYYLTYREFHKKKSSYHLESSMDFCQEALLKRSILNGSDCKQGIHLYFSKGGGNPPCVFSFFQGSSKQVA